jgi:hypothetical protein
MARPGAGRGEEEGCAFHNLQRQRETPLSACRHLPREGGDRCVTAFAFACNVICTVEGRGKAARRAISPLAGEMPTGREGRVARTYPQRCGAAVSGG